MLKGVRIENGRHRQRRGRKGEEGRLGARMGGGWSAVHLSGWSECKEKEGST